jgi:hypothetical protein
MNIEINKTKQFFPPQLIIWLKILLVIKFIFLAVGALAPFNHPHIWRQTDTLSVSYRYFLRWFIEKDSSNYLLPAILSTGNANGIMPMEFPVLNLITAPFFIFGIEYGRIFSQWFLIAFCFFATYHAFKIFQGYIYNKIPISLSIMLFPLMILSGNYIGRFMPDYLSFILGFLSIGYGLKGKKWIAFFLLSLSLLIKPTSIIVLLVFLVFEKNFRALLKEIKWTLPAIFICLLYYTKGVDYLKELSDTALLYKTGLPNPFDAFLSFFLSPREILDFLAQKTIGFFILPLILIVGTVNYLIKRESPFSLIWLLLLFQMLIIALIDGAHSFIHYYYFIGMSPLLSLSLLEVIYKVEQKWLWIAVLIILTISNVERGIYRVQPIFKNENIYTDCKKLKAELKEVPWGQGLIFRSSQEKYPEIGLCFGERTGGTNSNFGIFINDSQIPDGCFIIGKGAFFTVIQCGKRF